MNGWHFSAYRQSVDRFAPASRDSALGERLAVWQGPWKALDWLRDLCSNGVAIDLGGNGYPSRITAPARFLLSSITAVPLGARNPWVVGPEDAVDFTVWPGRTVLNNNQIEECDPNEWLLVVIWDES